MTITSVVYLTVFPAVIAVAHRMFKRQGFITHAGIPSDSRNQIQHLYIDTQLKCPRLSQGNEVLLQNQAAVTFVMTGLRVHACKALAWCPLAAAAPSTPQTVISLFRIDIFPALAMADLSAWGKQEQPDNRADDVPDIAASSPTFITSFRLFP